MDYVNGYVLAVPTNKRAEYQALAQTSASFFKSNGATSVVECWGDAVPDGKLTSFPMAVKCQADETVVFSWVTWPSKEAHDAGMKKVMDNPKFHEEMQKMPVDGKRMIFGSFQMIVKE